MIFVCKRYEGMNREIHGQVTRDINYLVEQIDDLYRVKPRAKFHWPMMRLELPLIAELHNSECINVEYATNKADLAMQARPGSYSDQSAWNEILGKAHIDVFWARPMPIWWFWARPMLMWKSGWRTFLFSDRETAATYEKLLTPQAKRSPQCCREQQ